MEKKRGLFLVYGVLFLLCTATAFAVCFGWTIQEGTSGTIRSWCQRGDYRSVLTVPTPLFFASVRASTNTFEIFRFGYGEAGVQLLLNGKIVAQDSVASESRNRPISTKEISGIANEVRVCGNNIRDRGATWWAFANANSDGNSVTQTAENKYLGRVRDYIAPAGIGTLTVSTSTPGIKLTIEQNDIYACTDSDQDNTCDYRESQTCRGQGGDWYKGKCCGVDVKACQFDTGVNALCGKPTPTTWEWAPVDSPGEVHRLLDCPGGALLSDGKALYSCGEQLQGTTTPFGEYRTVTVGNTAHEFQCFNKVITECRGRNAWACSPNALPTGSTAQDLPSLSCPAGLAAYWPLDNARATDAYGTAEGVVREAQGVQGFVGGALNFDGTNDRVEIPNTPSLNVVRAFTLEARVYPTALDGRRAIANKGNSYELVIEDGFLKAAINRPNSLWTLEGTNTQLTPDAWSHVALTYDGQTLKIFINGDKKFEKPLPGQVQTSTLPFFLGDKADAPTLPSAPYRGIIDEVILYHRALGEGEIRNRSQAAQSPCTALEQPSTPTYCAADGDWTQDLDQKDELSCAASGFGWTGTLCCSEADDPAEYYNDPGRARTNLTEHVLASGSAQVSDERIVLDEPNAFVMLRGPLTITVNASSQQELYAGEFVLCQLLDSSEIVIPEGKTQTIINQEPADEIPAGCALRETVITYTPTRPIGGCWDKRLVPSGQFASENVLNHHGTFYGCAIADTALLDIQDTKTQAPLIQNKEANCDSVLLNTRSGALPHAVCAEEGWQFTDAVGGNVEKSIRWTLVSTTPGMSTSGCCAAEQCWNGTACVGLNTFYRIGERGFVCK